MWRLLDAVCEEVAAPTWDANAFERVRDRLVRALRNVDKARADSHSSRWRRELCDEGRPPVGEVRDAVGAVGKGTKAQAQAQDGARCQRLV